MYRKLLYIFPFVLLFCLSGQAQTDLPRNTPLEVGTANPIDLGGTKKSGNVLNIPSVINNNPTSTNLLDSLSRRPVKMLPDRQLRQAGHDLKIGHQSRKTRKGWR